jgi:hypothetical protein
VIVPFKSIQTDDPALMRMQKAIADAIVPIAKSPIVDCAFIEDLKLTLSPSDNFIQHGLGREVRGWFIVKSNAYVIIKTSPTQNKLPERQLIVQVDGDATVSLIIF